GVGRTWEGSPTRFLCDRGLALENVGYVRSAAGRLGLSFQPDSFVIERAHRVLDEVLALLRQIGGEGLLQASAGGSFGVTRRPPDGGRGLERGIGTAGGSDKPHSGLLPGACPPAHRRPQSA